ncbi:cysteine peptidase family C39 domain-containing protein [Pseudoxanthobacter sp.]|uniref:cysteine peptidase family C39 domain-containing protein n=1 Tax=Pseudoxanthobacter sp. TaxID=1925742 RepID=UPI002FDFB3BE
MARVRGGRGRARRVPAILQMETAECGPACLAMVLAAHGRWETLDAVRDSCGVSRDGTSAADIVEAARRRGMEADAYSRDIDGLAALGLPQILFWGFDHFVVLEAVGRNGFVIVDPANGRRVVDREEFGRRFTGVTLTFRPGAEFRRTPRPPGIARRLAAVLGGSWDMFVCIVLTSLAMVVLGVVLPGLTRVFVDDYLVQGNREWLLPLLGGIIAVGAFRSMIAALYTRGLLLVQTKVTAVVSARFVWRLFQLPYDFFVRRSPVEISARTQYAGQLGSMVAGPFAQTAVNVLAVAGYIAIMLLYSVVMTAVCVGFAVLELLVLRLVTRRVQDEAVQLQMAAGQAHSAAVRGAALLEQARVNGSETQLFSHMVEAEVRLINSEQKSGWTTRMLMALPFAMSRLTTLAVLGVGAFVVMTTETTLGTLLGFLMLSGLLSSSIGALTGFGTAIGQSTAGMGRLGDVLDHIGAAEDGAAAGQGPLPLPTGRIALQDVGFSYPHGEPVLSGIALAVAPGACIGIMGGSGAGKSTLARLVVGLAAPTCGTIRFEARAGAEAWVPKCDGVGFVDQAPFFPKGPIRSALTLWDAAETDDDIAGALADAELLEAVAGRPGGLDGQVGENGVGFSSGERQRLAIARALVHAPRILVLDDATSALDEDTEARVLENLRRRGATLLLFTNRASALQHMDRVMALHGGRLYPVAMGEAHAAARTSMSAILAAAEQQL